MSYSFQSFSNEFTASLLSSVISTTVVYPVDVLKTQIQINQKSTVPNLVKNICKTQGVAGFYKGLTPSLCTYPIFWSVYFLGETQHLIKNPMLNSFVAASVASVFVNPLFVIKTRLQTDILNQKLTYNNSFDTVKTVVKNERIPGLFKGLTTTVILNSKLAFQLPAYYKLKDLGYSTFNASILSKTAASLLFYPLDLIRTQQRNVSTSNLSILDTVKLISKTSYRSFYRGFFMYSLTTVPNFVLMMLVREQLK